MLNTAFVFPGQGSQSVGMLSDFVPQYDIIRDTFSESSAAVGYDLWQLVQHGPEATLNQTEFTQVAMLTRKYLKMFYVTQIFMFKTKFF